MPPSFAVSPSRALRCVMGALLTLATACADTPASAPCEACGVLVVGAVGEPSTLLPPLVQEAIGRDISDLVFERLAYLIPGRAPLDPEAFRPGLASTWERVDSLTWRFHLRPDARWHDGTPVTAEDVAFSFAAYTDSALAGAAPMFLSNIGVTAESSSRVLLRFAAPSPEQLYDATYHIRILPAHIWRASPPAMWPADTSLGRLIGSGPYRLRRWTRGESIELVADTTDGRRAPGLTRVIWRFTSAPDAAVNLLLAHEVDVLETAFTPELTRRAAADTAYRAVSYASAIYGFLAFRLADHARRPHPMLGDRSVRVALTRAIDRAAAATAVFGPDTKVPPGPMSQGLWIWDEAIRTIHFDPAAARATLTARTVRPIDILVPATSGSRRQLAQIVQAAWRDVGVEATITVVDFPIFQERLAAGRFDSYIGVYLDEPSPRGLADQWSRTGWNTLNYGRYDNARFDALLARASTSLDPAAARTYWREAMDTLNADAPAIFLFAPTNTAIIHRRLTDVTIDPYAWASTLPQWRVDSSYARGAVSP